MYDTGSADIYCVGVVLGLFDDGDEIGPRAGEESHTGGLPSMFWVNRSNGALPIFEFGSGAESEAAAPSTLCSCKKMMSVSCSSVGVSLELADVILTDRQSSVWVEDIGPGLLASPILRLGLDVILQPKWIDSAGGPLRMTDVGRDLSRQEPVQSARWPIRMT